LAHAHTEGFVDGKDAGRREAMRDLRAMIEANTVAMTDVVIALQTQTARLGTEWWKLGEVLRGESLPETPPHMTNVEDASIRFAPQIPKQATTPMHTQPRRPDPTRAQLALSKELNRGEQRILDAIAELNALGIARPDRDQVGVFARLVLSAGAGSRYVARLAKDGYIAVESGALTLLPKGAALARADARPRSLGELHRRVLDRLESGPSRVLAALLQYREGTSFAREELGVIVGLQLSAGAGSRYLGYLTKFGFADIPAPGRIQAGKLLFPSGLR
jgi:hypothetical protein